MPICGTNPLGPYDAYGPHKRTREQYSNPNRWGWEIYYASSRYSSGFNPPHPCQAGFAGLNFPIRVQSSAMRSPALVVGWLYIQMHICEHRVTTLDLNSLNGNRRTQAAAIMNQHAASLHVRKWAPLVVAGRPHAHLRTLPVLSRQ
jgi:hypothetical protein